MNESRVAMLEAEVNRLRRDMESLGRQARLGVRRNPRLAITARDPNTNTYTTPANQYWIKFVDAAFDDQLDGLQSLTFYQERQTDALRTARVIGDAMAIAEGAAIEVLYDGFGENAGWWIPPFGITDPIVGVPPLLVDDGIVTPIASGWFSGRLATYNVAIDQFAIGTQDIWVRSLNCNPLEYIVANWMGFAKYLGDINPFSHGTRPAYVIETVPHPIEYAKLNSVLTYRGTTTAKLLPTAFNVNLTVKDMMLNSGQTLPANTIVTIGRHGCFRGVIAAGCVAETSIPNLRHL